MGTGTTKEEGQCQKQAQNASVAEKSHWITHTGQNYGKNTLRTTDMAHAYSFLCQNMKKAACQDCSLRKKAVAMQVSSIV
jgi:hypothetical protein